MPEVVITSYGLRKKISVEITGENSNIWILEMGNYIQPPITPVEPVVWPKEWELSLSQQALKTADTVKLEVGIACRSTSG
jgi:hypothetical protein